MFSCLVRAPAWVPGVWDWCFKFPQRQEGIPGIPEHGVSLQLNSSSWGPCSHQKLDPLSRQLQGGWTVPGFSSSPQTSPLALPRTRWLQPHISALWNCSIKASCKMHSSSFPVFPGISCFTNPTALTADSPEFVVFLLS